MMRRYMVIWGDGMMAYNVTLWYQAQRSVLHNCPGIAYNYIVTPCLHSYTTTLYTTRGHYVSPYHFITP